MNDLPPLLPALLSTGCFCLRPYWDLTAVLPIGSTWSRQEARKLLWGLFIWVGNLVALLAYQLVRKRKPR